MNVNNAIEIKNLKKEFKNFVLNIPELNIPEGFATALIGENGAGKTTLLNILEKQIENNGFVSSTCFFNPSWTLNHVAKISPLLFESFDKKKFKNLCTIQELWDMNKNIEHFSTGMKMKAMLAATLARDTDILLLDEPASSLDPVSREELCNLIRDYIHNNGKTEKTVLFSTHNISDMENVTDYAIIMNNGEIVEEGFVDELKEKYILIKGEADDAHKLGKYLFGFTKNSFGCQGLCEASDLDKLAGFNIEIENPTLNQISVGIMKKYSVFKI